MVALFACNSPNCINKLTENVNKNRTKNDKYSLFVYIVTFDLSFCVIVAISVVLVDCGCWEGARHNRHGGGVCK